MQLPIGAEENFKGLVDIVTGTAYVWDDDKLGAKYRTVDVPEDMVEQLAAYREKLVEAVADYDEALMEKYLDGEEVSAEEIAKALRAGTIQMNITPGLLWNGL